MVPLLVLLLSSIFAQYVAAPQIIDNSSICYLIENVDNANYECAVNLHTPCYYDIIIKNSRNIKLTCSFDKILVYNSTNVIIEGSGTVYAWDSEVNCLPKEKILVTLTNISSLSCLPLDVYAKLHISKLARGVLSFIKVKLRSASDKQNVLVELKSSCLSKIKAINSSYQAILSDNFVIYPYLPANTTITIYYGVIPISGDNCQFILTVKENQQNIISKEYKTNVYGPKASITNVLKLSEHNIVSSIIKHLLQLFYS